MTKLNWEEFGRALDKAIAEEAGTAAKEVIDRLRLQFPEKFLGKAEEPTEYFSKTILEPYVRPSHPGICAEGPDLPYAIATKIEVKSVIAAFRDEATRDRVLEFLNK